MSRVRRRMATRSSTAHGTQAANLALYRNARVDPSRELRGVHSLFRQSAILMTNATSPYRSVADVVKAAKEAPGKLNFASAGQGTQTHLAAARFEQAAGINDPCSVQGPEPGHG
jgi:tripartite-type tricarboxylate transporter receptor subunit TctC